MKLSELFWARCTAQEPEISPFQSQFCLTAPGNQGLCISHVHTGQLPCNASHIYFSQEKGGNPITFSFPPPSSLSSTICNYRSPQQRFGLCDRLLTHRPSPTNFRYFKVIIYYVFPQQESQINMY